MSMNANDHDRLIDEEISMFEYEDDLFQKE